MKLSSYFWSSLGTFAVMIAGCVGIFLFCCAYVPAVAFFPVLMSFSLAWGVFGLLLCEYVALKIRQLVWSRKQPRW